MGERGAESRPARVVVPFGQSPGDLTALAAGAAEGDAAAILALFERFGPMVNRLVWRLLGADDEHGDVVQDVFLGVLESIGRVESPEFLEAWIYSVTVNKVRRAIDKRRYLRLFRLTADPGRGHAVPSDPDTLLELRQFYEVLDRMPTNERIIFTLRFVDGQRLEDISTICNCSLATAKRRLDRARDAYFKLGGEAVTPQLRRGHRDE